MSIPVLVAAAKSLQSCPTLCNLIDGSPGKNTGVGCHFLLQCMKVKSESEVAQSVEGVQRQARRVIKVLEDITYVARLMPQTIYPYT